MRNKWKKRIGSLVIAAAVVVGAIVSPTTYMPEVKAAGKAYCAGLKLNNEIKLNKKKTYEKTGIYQENTFFQTAKKIKVQYTIASKRKSVGSNYKVTYNVNYKLLGDPQIDVNQISYDDWYWGLTTPSQLYTVFDYQTGISLETKNELGVKVKGSKWKYSYYPKQKYKYTGALEKEYKDEEQWLRNIKSVSYSFTVTYPKKCRDVVVGIGFANRVEVPSEIKDEVDNQYWEGKKPYGKTSYYKKGKNTMSYMRLK